jgi:pilus assembly protein CpaD
VSGVKNMAIVMRKFIQLSALSVALLWISGCTADDALLDDASHRPVNASDSYPITLVKGPRSIDVASTQGTLQPLQINAVASFVHQALQAGVTPMTVSRPSGGGNSARVASEIASLMVGQGVRRENVRFVTYPGSANAPVHISYISSYAKTKKCGDWSEDLTDTDNNTGYKNLGCAVQANIAAEIAYPETIVAPAAVDLPDAAAQVLAVTNQQNYVSTITNTTTTTAKP